MATNDVKIPQQSSGGLFAEQTLTAILGVIGFNSLGQLVVHDGGALRGIIGASAYIPAGACRATVTNGAAAGVVQIASGQPQVESFDFDTSTEEHVQLVLPYNGNWGTAIKAKFHWSHAATTTNFGVTWRVQALAMSNDDALGVAWSNGQLIADTGGTTNDLYTSDWTPSCTIEGSPATGDLVFFRFSRVPSDGSDTMAIDARLMYVEIDKA